MALTITKVPDATYLLGESGVVHEYELAPATSDYVTGGWPITAAQVGLGYLNRATISATNAAGALYTAAFVFPAGSFVTPPQPATTCNLLLSQSGTQIANGTNLVGLKFFADFRGW